MKRGKESGEAGFKKGLRGKQLMFTIQGRSDVHLSPLKWIEQQINTERYKVSTYLTFIHVCIFTGKLGLQN